MLKTRQKTSKAKSTSAQKCLLMAQILALKTQLNYPKSLNSDTGQYARQGLESV